MAIFCIYHMTDNEKSDVDIYILATAGLVGGISVQNSHVCGYLRVVNSHGVEVRWFRGGVVAQWR